MFSFTDPFQLFNSLFGDVHRFDSVDPFDPFHGFHRHMRSPFDSMFNHQSYLYPPVGSSSPFRSPLLDMMSGNMGIGGSGTLRSYSSSAQAMGFDGQWVSQSQMTRTINGRTETIIKKRDADGNEHITYSSPEGERYTINGVEQRTENKYISAPSQPHIQDHNSYGYDRALPQASSYSVPVQPTPNYATYPTPEPVRRHHSHREGMCIAYPIIDGHLTRVIQPLAFVEATRTTA